jgi:hypothetical protein
VSPRPIARLIKHLIGLSLLNPRGDAVHLLRDLPHQRAGDAGVGKLVGYLRHPLKLLSHSTEPSSGFLLPDAGLLSGLLTRLVEQVTRLPTGILGYLFDLRGGRPGNLTTCLLHRLAHLHGLIPRHLSR